MRVTWIYTWEASTRWASRVTWAPTWQAPAGRTWPQQDATPPHNPMHMAIKHERVHGCLEDHGLDSSIIPQLVGVNSLAWNVEGRTNRCKFRRGCSLDDFPWVHLLLDALHTPVHSDLGFVPRTPNSALLCADSRLSTLPLFFPALLHSIFRVPNKS